MGPREAKQTRGWIGVACWLLILPAKGARHFDLGVDSGLIDIAPSVLGPAGLLFVILSNEGRLKDLTLTQAIAIAGAIALAAEFAQLLPFVRQLYTFDWLDVLATMAALGVAALVSGLIDRVTSRG